MKPIDLQDKKSWCEHGRKLEDLFVERFGESLSLKINEAKTDNVYAVDMLNTKDNLLADLKTQNTPFFLAGKKYEVDPQYAVVFNKKDKLNYIDKTGDGSDMYIYFWVQWKDEERFNVSIKSVDSIYRIKFSALLGLLKESKLHRYNQRKGDTRGNARSSYVLDVRSMELVLENNKETIVDNE